jgi:hypothetical protein
VLCQLRALRSNLRNLTGHDERGDEVSRSGQALKRWYISFEAQSRLQAKAAALMLSLSLCVRARGGTTHVSDGLWVTRSAFADSLGRPSPGRLGEKKMWASAWASSSCTIYIICRSYPGSLTAIAQALVPYEVPNCCMYVTAGGVLWTWAECCERTRNTFPNANRDLLLVLEPTSNNIYATHTVRTEHGLTMHDRTSPTDYYPLILKFSRFSLELCASFAISCNIREILRAYFW